jgi:hypothetical protein
MSKGFFTDKTSKPTNYNISKIIGKAKINWEYILNYITTELNLKGDFKFYGINYGWALRFKKSGKSIISLYPDKDCFTIQVILNKTQIESALSENLNEKLVKTIRNTNEFNEGKWIFIRIDKESDMRDILVLVKIRIKIK